MTSYLFYAATLFFAAGAVDYTYRLGRTIVWDFADYRREVQWRKQMEEMQKEAEAEHISNKKKIADEESKLVVI